MTIRRDCDDFGFLDGLTMMCVNVSDLFTALLHSKKRKENKVE